MLAAPRSLSVSLQMAAAGFNALISMLLVAILARTLSASEFGGYVSTLSLAIALLILLEGGWPQRVYRDSALDTTHASAALASNAVAHVIFAGLGLMALGLVLPLGLPGLVAALLCMTCVALMNLISARMRAAGQFGLEAAWQMGGRTCSALAILGAVLLGWTSPAMLFLAWAAGLAAMLLPAAGRWLRFPAWRGWRLGISQTVPFLLVEVLSALLMKGDVAILRAWGGSEDSLAHYAACTRLNEAALLLFAPVGNVMLRELRLVHADRAAFDLLWRTWLARASALGLAAVAGSWLLGEWLMVTLFGDGFAAAGTLLGFTSLMLPCALGNLVLVVASLARGDERWLATRLGPAVAMLIVGMGIGWALLEARGAALAVAAAQLLTWVVVLRRLSGLPVVSDSGATRRSFDGRLE